MKHYKLYCEQKNINGFSYTTIEDLCTFALEAELKEFRVEDVSPPPTLTYLYTIKHDLFIPFRDGAMLYRNLNKDNKYEMVIRIKGDEGLLDLEEEEGSTNKEDIWFVKLRSYLDKTNSENPELLVDYIIDNLMNSD